MSKDWARQVERRVILGKVITSTGVYAEMPCTIKTKQVQNYVCTKLVRCVGEGGGRTTHVGSDNKEEQSTSDCVVPRSLFSCVSSFCYSFASHLVDTSLLTRSFAFLYLGGRNHPCFPLLRLPNNLVLISRKLPPTHTNAKVSKNAHRLLCITGGGVPSHSTQPGLERKLRRSQSSPHTKLQPASLFLIPTHPSSPLPHRPAAHTFRIRCCRCPDDGDGAAGAAASPPPPSPLLGPPAAAASAPVSIDTVPLSCSFFSARRLSYCCCCCFACVTGVVSGVNYTHERRIGRPTRVTTTHTHIRPPGRTP